MSDRAGTAQTTVRCTFCYRPIHKARSGEWYHNHNASVACKPGWTRNKATPR